MNQREKIGLMWFIWGSLALWTIPVKDMDLFTYLCFFFITIIGFLMFTWPWKNDTKNHPTS